MAPLAFLHLQVCVRISAFQSKLAPLALRSGVPKCLSFPIYARWFSRWGSILAWRWHIRTLLVKQGFQKPLAIAYTHTLLSSGVPKCPGFSIYARFSKKVIVHLALLCVYEEAKVSWHPTLQICVHISSFQSKLAPLAPLIL